ncbi:flagellin [Nocardioidaceae bacterium]|nr:flagellin [Nocardioidaceae bacterium]
MGLRINQNIDAFNSYRNLSVTQGQMSKSLEKLSSGLRINRAADDAAGLAISEGLRTQIGGLKVAARNAQDGISVSQTAEGALTEVHSMLQRMRDLAVQSANGSNNQASRNALDAEAQQLKAELDRISQATNFNGVRLLDGTFSAVFQVGSEASDSITIDIDGVDTTSLGIGAVDLLSDANARTAMGTLDDAITAVSTVRANLGAVQNRFEHTIANLNVAVENLSASESRIRDTDMALEMTQFTKSQILSQAGTAMLAQANQAPQDVLRLLNG